MRRRDAQCNTSSVESKNGKTMQSKLTISSFYSSSHLGISNRSKTSTNDTSIIKLDFAAVFWLFDFVAM